MKITIEKTLSLEYEIQGFKNDKQETLLKGLVNEALPIKTKYWLNKLFAKVESEKKSFMALRDELIKTLGEEKEDGSIEIPITIKEELNPKFVDFKNQEKELLEEEIEIEGIKFNIEDFDFSTESNYPIFMDIFLS
jgi:hypothetical protein